MKFAPSLCALAVLTCALSTAQAQVTYNMLEPHTGHNAYDGSIPASPLPPTTNTVPSAELSETGEYDNIESSNNNSHTNNPSTGNRAAQRYVFTLAQSGPSIFDLDVLWEGQTTTGTPVGVVSLYIWNASTSSYTLIGSHSNSSSDQNITAVYTSVTTPPVSQLVDGSNKVTLLVVNSTATEGVETDYVRLIVRQCASAANCDDGNVCTTNTCTAGLCSYPNNTAPCATDNNSCTNDVCAAGVCTHPAVANGTSCNDSNACTQTDTCQTGTCTGSNPVVCTPLSQCHNAGTCAPATGVCSNPPKPDGAPCEDGLICNGAEACLSGSCAAGTPVDCGDDVDCTVDTCEESGGGPFTSTAVSHVNGATHVVSLGSPPVGDFTAMMWARINADRGAPSTFMFIGGSIANPKYFNSFYLGSESSPQLRTWVQALTPGTEIDGADSDVLQVGDWHHLALVGNAASSGAVSLYLDGVLQQSGNAAAGTYIGELIEIMNAPLNGGNDRMVGSFAAWKRYNVQLSQAEIQAELPYSRAQRRTNLVQEVTFLNNTDLMDQSGNGNHFTVTGPALANSATGPNIQGQPSVTCVHTPNNAFCDDGLYCDGVETCHATLDCQEGTAPVCNDNVSCTVDSCNESTDSCDFVLNHGLCSDGAFCDGAEVCHLTLGCQEGTAPNCDDSVACTDDSCNEATDSCDHVASDSACSDGQHCNGAETCHLTMGCQAGTAPDCDDAVACTDDTCNEGSDTCDHVANDGHCADALFCNGDETCHLTLGCQAGTAPDCADAVPCTDDSCNEAADACDHVPNHGLCSDDAYCDGAEVCHVTQGCQEGTTPNCDDSVACTDDSCNEATDSCDHVANDGLCSDGAYCDGAEVCHVTQGCQEGTAPNCDDSVACTDDSCNESTDSCDHALNHGFCSNGNFCDGDETCHMTLDCQDGPDPNCADEVDCTDDTCEGNACVHTPNHAHCPDDTLHCTGAEFCDAIEGCLSAGDPCPIGQLCNDATDTCGVCLQDQHCNDNVDCTDNRCVLGGCQYPPNNEGCPDDGAYCNGSEFCDALLGCQSTGNPCSEAFVCREGDDSCVACLSDSDCSLSDPPYCEVVSGTCVECLTDANCDEGDPCIEGHACVNNACHPGTAVGCSEFNTACITVSCDPAGEEGNCDVDTPLTGNPCSDGSECTTGDVCTEGLCTPGTPAACDPPDQCHAAGVCNPATGICQYQPLEDGTACSDGNACTNDDACQTGACVPGTPSSCDPPEPCHASGTCNPATGICEYPQLDDGAACSDDNACTVGDACQAGACVPGTTSDCALPDQCHGPGTCNPGTGLCEYPNLDDGTACSDDNACTVGDACQAGACVPGTTSDCALPDQCHGPGTCNPGTGLCEYPNLDDGTACSDDNACTVGDACQAGACVPGTTSDCALPDQCHGPGTCNPGTGLCEYPNLDDGTACNDGSECTTGDVCTAGACVPGTSTVCDPPDQCHSAGTCNPETGACTYPALPDGTACSDGSECTTGDVCTAGACTPGTPTLCLPEGPCQTATCNPETGDCLSEPSPDGTSCDDGNDCTDGDVCNEGACHGEQVYTLTEWKELTQCLQGPDVVVGEECECSNLELDEYMDLRDVAEFMNRFGR